VTDPRHCESGCGCRYGTDDPDRNDCACDGPCCFASEDDWNGTGTVPVDRDLLQRCDTCLGSGVERADFTTNDTVQCPDCIDGVREPKP
jgi:hypothetical protein